MGEVRLKIRITNAGDEYLNRRRKLAKKKIRSCEVDAVVDTGAIKTCVPQHVLAKLGVLPMRISPAQLADGSIVHVGVSEPVSMQILDRETSESVLIMGTEVLIGQTALESTDCLVDCARQQVVPRISNTPVFWVR